MVDVQAPVTSRVSLAADAYIWGFPRMLYDRYLGDFRKAQGPLNRFLAMDRMATPDQGGVNVDTLYGVAWLDVGAEPVVLDIPDAQDRYYSIQLIDVHANNFAYVGRRTTGTQAQRVLVAGLHWSGKVPDGMQLIRAPSRYVFCFLRTLIDDADDVAVANHFHDRLTVSPLSAYPQGAIGSWLLADLDPYFPRAHNYLERLGAAYFDRLGDALTEDPPTHRPDVDAMTRFADAGIGPGLHPSLDAPESSALLEEAVSQGNQKIFSAQASTAREGWAANWRVDEGGCDPLFKATVNRFGIGTLSVEEAIYLLPASLSLKAGDPVPAWTSLGPDGEPLSGQKRYRLHFPAGQLPQVDAFWSLTLYGADFHLYRNAIDRYAIGDRTAGLVYGDDGSLEILIQHEPPSSGTSNWLPTPAAGFSMIFRAYQPRPAFLKGDYQLPPLEIIGA